MNMQTQSAMIEVGIGAVLRGGRAGVSAGRVALWPARVALRAPLVGSAADRFADALAREGHDALVASRARAEADLDRLVQMVLDDPRTERLAIQVLESHLLDHLSERVLSGPEMQRLVDRIATSPEIREAISRQSETLANEVVSDVRTRSEDADESIERHVRGWLRRPRPATP